MGALARFMPPHRRVAIEAEIEQHLQRVTLLIARLDRADAPFEDMEDDDPPGGDPLDSCEGPGDFRGGCSDDGGYCSGLLAVSPTYAIDQRKGPTNYAELERARIARNAVEHRHPGGGWFERPRSALA